MVDFSKITVRPIYTAPKNHGQKIWAGCAGHFFREVFWDQEIEKWVPDDEHIRHAMRRGTCTFDPEFWIVEVADPEDTYWNGTFWTEREPEVANV